jgi:hypothetical protein
MHCEGLFTCRRCAATGAMCIVATYADADAATKAECFEDMVDECK